MRWIILSVQMYFSINYIYKTTKHNIQYWHATDHLIWPVQRIFLRRILIIKAKEMCKQFILLSAALQAIKERPQNVLEQEIIQATKWSITWDQRWYIFSMVLINSKPIIAIQTPLANLFAFHHQSWVFHQTLLEIFSTPYLLKCHKMTLVTNCKIILFRQEFTFLIKIFFLHMMHSITMDFGIGLG